MIKDDIKHQHTVTGMNLLGFGNDNAELNICISVFSLMELNINDRRLEHLTDEYKDRAYHVTEIHFNDKESFERLATGMCDWLVLLRHPPWSSLKGGKQNLSFELRFPSSFSLSALALKEKSIWRKFGQNEKQNENEVKEKSTTIAMLFSFRDPGGILTPDRWSRNPVLYTAELRSRKEIPSEKLLLAFRSQN